ncbi:MAG: histidinol dehydrogenase, partial [Pseudomonadota bacterium]|nr:histidinol dehydrogenase [Pseudomonadota bacterium]
MNRIEWSVLNEAAKAQVLQRPVQAVSASVRDAVSRIRADVSANGDAALRALTAQFDGVDLISFEVGEEEFAVAEATVPADLRAAMQEAAGRIEAFHRAGIATPYEVETAPGLRCERIQRPIGRVGLYVPAGSAPLPSTALMLTIPAGLAGCRDIILCTPPRADGSADPAVLVAARMT